MKKYLAGLLALGASLGSFVSADLANVDLDFCNKANHLVMTVATGESNADICMHFSNSSTQPITIDIGIVDGEFAQGGKPTAACKTSANGVFGQSIALSGDSVLTIPGGSVVEMHASFTVQSGFAGVAHGCLTYTIANPAASEGMVSIVDRKANLVDIVVPGNVISRFGIIPILSVVQNSGQLEAYGDKVAGDENVQFFRDRQEDTVTILMGLENTGFVDEEYMVDITRTSLFGLIKSNESTSSASLYPQEKILYQRSVDQVHWYEGWLSTNITLKHRVIELGLEGANTSERQEINYTLGAWVTPWYAALGTLIVLIWLFVFIRHIIKRKKGDRIMPHWKSFFLITRKKTSS